MDHGFLFRILESQLQSLKLLEAQNLLEPFSLHTVVVSVSEERLLNKGVRGELTSERTLSAASSLLWFELQRASLCSPASPTLQRKILLSPTMLPWCISRPSLCPKNVSLTPAAASLQQAAYFHPCHTGISVRCCIPWLPYALQAFLVGDYTRSDLQLCEM